MLDGPRFLPNQEPCDRARLSFVCWRPNLAMLSGNLLVPQLMLNAMGSHCRHLDYFIQIRNRNSKKNKFK